QFTEHGVGGGISCVKSGGDPSFKGYPGRVPDVLSDFAECHPLFIAQFSYQHHQLIAVSGSVVEFPVFPEPIPSFSQIQFYRGWRAPQFIREFPDGFCVAIFDERVELFFIQGFLFGVNN
ncbi:TPA: hypothetical protein ACV8FT_005968, partial [Escherichia coli]